MQKKNRLAAHKRAVGLTGEGQNPEKLSALDEQVAAIIGDSAISGINCTAGDTDLEPTVSRSNSEAPSTDDQDEGKQSLHTFI